jgi:polysaccharide biosynthesis transport protein
MFSQLGLIKPVFILRIWSSAAVKPVLADINEPSTITMFYSLQCWSKISMGSESVVHRRDALEPVSPVAGQGEGELDLSGIWAAIKRRKKLIFLMTAGAFAASLAFVVLVKPRYTGEAKLLVENQESYFTRPDRNAAADVMPDSEAVASQIQLITSRDLAREAIKRLNLKGNPEFDPASGGEGALSRILSLIGLKNSRANLTAEDRIYEKYIDRLKAFALPKSRVLTVEFNSRDRELAARGANLIADLYIETQSKAKRDRASVSAASLATLISELRTKLAEAETRVETFRASTGLLMGANNATVPTQQLGEISSQLAAARNAMAESQAKARLIRSLLQRGRLDELSDVARDDLVRRVSEQRSNLRARLASEARTLGPAHPRIQELTAQLSTIERELRSAGSNVARGLENDAQIARSRVDNLVAAIEQQKQQVGDTSADQVKLREYEMEAKLLKEQLEGNTTKYREALARQQSESTPADARVISRAVVPDKASFPKVIPILLFAAIGAMVLTIAWIIAAELLSGRALIPVSAASSGPTLAPRAVSAPLPGGDRPSPASGDGGKEDGLDPAARRVLSRMLRFNTGAYAARVLACSPGGRVDPGASVEPLARTLAGERRAVLVDLSGRALAGLPGLSDLISGEASFADVIHRDPGSRLHLVGAGTGAVAITEELDDALDALSQTYEFVLLVAPQNDADQLALQLAPAIDFALLAVSAAAAGDEAIAMQNELLAAGAGQALLLVATAAVAEDQREIRPSRDAA